MFALNNGEYSRRYVPDPRQGRVKRIVAILALAAAAGAARAQQTTTTTTPSTLPPPLAKADAVANAVADEAKLLPCTLNDVKGEFSRLAQTGVLKMEALPCQAWVKLTVADSYGDNTAAVSSASSGDETLAFALTPGEATRLREAGIASGQAVALNDVITAVAVAPRTPGFTGVFGRLSRRIGDAGSVASKSLDGGRAFAPKAQYEDVALWGSSSSNGGGAGGTGGNAGVWSSSSSSVAPAAEADLPVAEPLNSEPHGTVVILTAADGPTALAARQNAREPHGQTDKASGEAAVVVPASVDARSVNTRLVDPSTGAVSEVPVEKRVQKPAVGGSPLDEAGIVLPNGGGGGSASSSSSSPAASTSTTTTLSVTSTSTVDGFIAGRASEAGRSEVVVPERLRRKERRRKKYAKKLR